MINNLSKYFIGGVSVILIILIISNLALKSEVDKLRADKALLDSAIELQNDIIKKNELDLEKYKNKKPQVIEKIIKKYEKVPIKNETCEKELQTIKNALNAYFNNN